MSKTKFQEPNEPEEAEVLSTPPHEFAVQVGFPPDLDILTYDPMKLREATASASTSTSTSTLGSISVTRPAAPYIPTHTGSDFKRSLDMILENQMRITRRLMDIETTLKTLIVITSTPPTP